MFYHAVKRFRGHPGSNLQDIFSQRDIFVVTTELRPRVENNFAADTGLKDINMSIPNGSQR